MTTSLICLCTYDMYVCLASRICIFPFFLLNWGVMHYSTSNIFTCVRFIKKYTYAFIELHTNIFIICTKNMYISLKDLNTKRKYNTYMCIATYIIVCGKYES